MYVTRPVLAYEVLSEAIVSTSEDTKADRTHARSYRECRADYLPFGFTHVQPAVVLCICRNEEQSLASGHGAAFQDIA